MQITDITVTRFTYENNVTADAEGHAHPGPKRQAKGALLRVETDEGVAGEVVAPGAAAQEDVLARFVTPRLKGTDPLRTEAAWYAMYHAQRGSGARLSDRVLAAVDLALWDLKGKAAGLPVWKLLGGYRDKVPAYGSTMCGDDQPGGLSSPEDYAAFAERLVARGYRGVKLHTWMSPMPGAPDVRRDYAACAAVREAVDPALPLMLDPHHFYSRSDAAWLGRKLAELGFLWMEEPMEEASMASYRWLTAATPGLDIVGPESMTGKHWIRADWAAAGAADRLRAGVWGVGGISPAMKVAHLAESFHMDCEIHGTGAGNLAVVAAIPNTTFYERGLLHPTIDYDAPDPYRTRLDDEMDDEGFVHLPEAPGLGQALDHDYIAANRV